MNINSIEISKDQLVIKLGASANITKIYLDELSNKDNIYSTKDTDHTYVITEDLGNKDSFSIDVSEYDQNQFIVTLKTSDESVSALAIDKEQLYYNIVDLLTKFCSTCLDKASLEKILMCQFRSNLLNYALENNLLDDSIEHYIDLCRIIDMNVKCKCDNQIICKKCINGCCAI